jgi:hypothetical protein
MSHPPFDYHHHRFGPRTNPKLPLQKGTLDLSAIPPRVAELIPAVNEVAREPFTGITTDGRIIPGLFGIETTSWDPAPAVRTALRWLELLPPRQRKQAVRDIDADEWRMWTNAFPHWEPHGLNLEDVTHSARVTALDIIEACMSAGGYVETRSAMRLNAALGALIDLYRDTLTEFCYWFAIFGHPSTTEPWGWQLYGHHLDLNCFILGSQIVLTPAFIGGEPVVADDGPYEGTRLFDDQRAAGLALRRSLRTDQAEAAVLYPSMRTEDLPRELRSPVDGRHKSGAGQDNRVIPYAGVGAAELTDTQENLVLDLAATYAHRLAGPHAVALLRDIERHLESTHFAWIGGAGDNDPFYYRIHSPVVMIEYDCHQGVFLDNDQPEPFHVHTIVRTPNGGDYGRDLLRQHLHRHHRTPAHR